MTRLPAERRPEACLVAYRKGVSLLSSGDFASALECFKRAMAISDKDIDACFNAGICCQKLGMLSEAIVFYQKAIAVRPDHVQAIFGLGRLYLDAGKTEKAVHWFERSLPLTNNKAAVYNNMGKAMLLQDNYAKALDYLKKTIEYDPGLAEAWFNLAELNCRSGRWNDAVSGYNQAINIKPDMSAAHNNLGNVFRKMKRHDDAIAAFQKVLALEPNLAEGYYNLGSAYRDNEQFEEALLYLAKAIEYKPHYAEAWSNLALTCKNMGDFERALRYFDKALSIDPNLAVAHWNRGFIHLLQGDWASGWDDFEWRFRIPEWKTLYPNRIEGHRWDGRPIPHQTLLVHDEQGLGDTFQFLRYLPWVRERCGCLVFETREALVELLADQRSIDRLIVRSPKYPPQVSFDQYIPLMSLARLSGTTSEGPIFKTPYITPDAAKKSYWRDRLPSGAIKVGLVWAGRPEHANDMNRSCGFERLRSLLDLDGIQFIGLQKGPAAVQSAMVEGRPNFMNLDDELSNFADTAGVMANLDLLVTVDTSVAHLAGAMGTPVWLMVPYIPDWRWGLEGSNTFWYPSMTLFRQKRPKDWDTVIEKLRSALVQWVGKSKSY